MYLFQYVDYFLCCAGVVSQRRKNERHCLDVGPCRINDPNAPLFNSVFDIPHDFVDYPK